MSSPRPASKFARLKGALHPRIRLFCFPFAGGSSPAFVGWGEALGPDIEVWAAQPRGRGVRFRDPLYGSVAEMVDDLLPLIQGHPDQGLSRDLPFAFYGHSLGGLVAFELTRRLQLEGMPTPERLLIGASVPPHMGLIHPRIEHLSDEQFVEAMQERYAGIPAAVLQEPELLELFLPVLRTDFAAYEGYEFEETGRVRCPLTAFAGAEDFAVTERVMSEWSRHTSSQFELRVVPGDHFFLSASRDRLLGYVREDLRRAIEIGLSDSLLNAGKS